MKHRKKLGELLIDSGLLNQQQLDSALAVQRKTGERLGKVLLNLEYISEQAMIEVLEFQLGIPHIDLTIQQIHRETAMLIPVSLAERYQAIPIQLKNRKLLVAMVDPTNFYAIDDIRMISGYDVEPIIATEKDVLRAIREIYGVRDLVEKAVNRLKPEEIAATEVETADDAPIVNLLNSLMQQAITDRASDIHIEPQEHSTRVRFRIDGMLREIACFPRDFHSSLIARVKIISDLDIAEKRVPQDGRIELEEGGHAIDLRVSTLPTIFGEKVVMRLLDKNAVILDIDKLGFTADNLRKYQQMYSQSYGMVLVTGPTGSGKTTTLYSTLSKVNAPDRNIITLEDPVEYRLNGINQVQINPKAGLTFAGGLRSILRQDPNIILLGEIRDSETADIAVRAALTGHLVFSTLHTNDAPGAVTRLMDMDVEPFLIASSVLGIIAQRLVRVLCPQCRQAYQPSADAVERLFMNIAPDAPLTLYKKIGCSHCSQTGYRGRMSIHEVLPITTAIRQAINNKASSNVIAAIARNEGMKTIREDGIAKALAGLTDLQEVMRVAYSETSGG